MMTPPLPQLPFQLRQLPLPQLPFQKPGWLETAQLSMIGVAPNAPK